MELRGIPEVAMKRSSKVMLLFMGTAAAGNLSAAPALALLNNACDPRPGFYTPDFGDDAATRCMTRGGFGGVGHSFAGHGHAHGHGG
jgi:hypothetical protein